MVKPEKLDHLYLVYHFAVPLSTNFTKWSNTLKQFVSKLPTSCFSVFDHFMGLAHKELKNMSKGFCCRTLPVLWCLDENRVTLTSGLRCCNQKRKVPVQTTVDLWPGLLTQPLYEVPCDLQVENVKTQ